MSDTATLTPTSSASSLGSTENAQESVAQALHSLGGGAAENGTSFTSGTKKVRFAVPEVTFRIAVQWTSADESMALEDSDDNEFEPEIIPQPTGLKRLKKTKTVEHLAQKALSNSAKLVDELDSLQLKCVPDHSPTSTDSPPATPTTLKGILKHQHFPSPPACQSAKSPISTLSKRHHKRSESTLRLLSLGGLTSSVSDSGYASPLSLCGEMSLSSPLTPLSASDSVDSQHVEIRSTSSSGSLSSAGSKGLTIGTRGKSKVSRAVFEQSSMFLNF